MPISFLLVTAVLLPTVTTANTHSVRGRSLFQALPVRYSVP